MKIITEYEVSNLLVPFIPSSVYIDGVQTYGFSMQDTNIMFNTTIAAGSELTVVPTGAIKIDDSEITSTSIDVVGYHSILSAPFGKILFSLDNVTWVKVLSYVFPTTVYLYCIPDDPVVDVKCRADYEIVIWKGPVGSKINEDGFVEVTTTEGIEYHVF
jgi:hypothetical protein